MMNKKTTIDDCILFNIKKVTDKRGSLCVLEYGNVKLPFLIQRIYYLFDFDLLSKRGVHAHMELQQVLICLSGSFKILLDDGQSKKELILDRPDLGLYIPPGIWREIETDKSSTICLVLASSIYTECDYINEYEKFKEFKLFNSIS